MIYLYVEQSFQSSYLICLDECTSWLRLLEMLLYFLSLPLDKQISRLLSPGRTYIL